MTSHVIPRLLWDTNIVFLKGDCFFKFDVWSMQTKMERGLEN